MSELKGYTYRTCVKDPPGFSGDYCELNNDCFSGICTNTNQYGTKLACYSENKLGNKICLPLIKEGNICIIRDNEEESNGSFGNCYQKLVCST